MTNQGLFRGPWRKLSEADGELRDFLKSYKCYHRETRHLRILLHGPVGAGKSSYINSVQSALWDRIYVQAQTDATSGTSWTLEYKTFELSRRLGSYHFVFNDTMGLEDGDSGITVKDLSYVLNGKVKDGYQFTNLPITRNNRYFNDSPSLADKVHVVVSVVPANIVENMSDEVIKKIREVREEASRIGIPQMIILTKVDEACPAVNNDIKNLHKSMKLKEMVDRLHQLLGIQINCIFLVKNYSSEVETSAEMNVQILHPLKQMIIHGEDYLKARKK